MTPRGKLSKPTSATGEPRSAASLANWTEAPQNRWTFSHVRELIPTRVISRGDGPVTDLRSCSVALEDVEFASSSGGTSRFADFVEASYTDGLVVLHRHKVVFEYCGGEYSFVLQHAAFSLTKSVVGMLTGILMAQGAFRRSDGVTAVLPELARSGWRDAKIDHLLDMTTGAHFVEDYEDRSGHVWDIRRILYGLTNDGHAQSAASIHQYLENIAQSSSHGRGFTYKSADSLVLTWIMERTTGTSLADLIESHIWSHLGAANDAYIILDRHDSAYGAGGLCATLHDLARFGLMVQNGGAIGSRQIVPEAWIDDTCNGDNRGFRSSKYAEWLPEGAYRNHWWLRRSAGGAMLAIGIHGQIVFIDRQTEMVIIKLSCWPSARMPNTLADTLSAFEAVAEQLGTPR